MKRLPVLAAVCVAAAAAFGGWDNLGDGSHYSGAKLTEESFARKVVLVYNFDSVREDSLNLLPRVQELWNSFGTKPLVVLGSHHGGKNDGVKKETASRKVTFPVYEGAYYTDGSSKQSTAGRFCVISHRGKIVFTGASDREATEALVTALGDVGRPPELTPGVSFACYKALAKQFQLGKSIKSPVKKLEDDVKKFGKMKKLTAVQQRQQEEAQAILASLKTGQADIKEEISMLRKSNPPLAVDFMTKYIATFPEDAEDYKAELPELKAAAKEFAKNQPKAAKGKK